MNNSSRAQEKINNRTSSDKIDGLLGVVTVGSTSFRSLIDSIIFEGNQEALKILSDRWKIRTLIVQHGTYIPDLSSSPTSILKGFREKKNLKTTEELLIGGEEEEEEEGEGRRVFEFNDPSLENPIDLILYEFTPRIDEFIAKADLVISHAGAGSILAFLRPICIKPKIGDRFLVIVPNDGLMDDHQSDLTDEIVKAGWATGASPSTLAQTLIDLKRSTEEDSSKIRSYSSSETGDDSSNYKFRDFLDRTMGFTSED